MPAFPSGHAAYAVTLVACATVLVRAGVGWAVRDRRRHRRVILVAVVARTRVYLRAHFLTDVLGGDRAGGRDLVARRRARPVRRARSSQWSRSDRRPEDLRHRGRGRRGLADRLADARRRARLEVLLARARPARGDVLSVYILAAFVLAGAGVGAAALWYFSDR